MKSPVTPLVFSLLAFGPILAAQQPVGVPNFHQINEKVYRGAQPSKQGFQSLASLGIKTIVDLRGDGGRSRDEQKVVEAAGMRYIVFGLSGYTAPSDEQVSKLLAILNDPAAGPVFVHCRRGADRTGTIIACYRMSHDHWDNAKAQAEADADGMSGLERAMKRYVRDYKVADASAAAPAAAAAAAPATAVVQ